MARQYLCSLSGECEYDPDHDHGNYGYETLEECRDRCRGSTDKELDYLTLQYSLSSAEDLASIAPSDRVELIRRETGVTVSRDDSLAVLFGISEFSRYDVTDDDYREIIVSLIRYPQLWQYAWLLDFGGYVKKLLLEKGSVEVLTFLREQEAYLEYVDWVRFLRHAELTPELKRVVFEELRPSFRLAPQTSELYYVLQDLMQENETLRNWYHELQLEALEWRRLR